MTLSIPGDDTYDPCAEYIELRKAYLAILKGEGLRRVRFRNGDEERETEFTQGNLKELKAAMDLMRSECMAKENGGRPQRSAIGIGRQGPYYGRRIY